MSVNMTVEPPRCNKHPDIPLMLQDRGFGPDWECAQCNQESAEESYWSWVESQYEPPMEEEL